MPATGAMRQVRRDREPTSVSRAAFGRLFEYGSRRRGGGGPTPSPTSASRLSDGCRACRRERKAACENDDAALAACDDEHLVTYTDVRLTASLGPAQPAGARLPWVTLCAQTGTLTAPDDREYVTTWFEARRPSAMTSAEPDVDGWCHHRPRVPPLRFAPLFRYSASLPGAADDAGVWLYYDVQPCPSVCGHYALRLADAMLDMRDGTMHVMGRLFVASGAFAERGGGGPTQRPPAAAAGKRRRAK